MKFQWVTAVAILALVVACGGIKSTVDYDRDADFSQYSTYAWHEGTGADIQDSDPLNHERLISAVDAQMAQAGFQKVDSNPDVLITYHGEDKEQTRLDTTYMGGGWGMGAGWGWGGMGMGGMGSSTTQVRNYTVGTLVLDMWDVSQKRLVYRATASDTLSDNPQKNSEKIGKAAEKLFENYPPGADN